jgi:hypothetical protein
VRATRPERAAGIASGAAAARAPTCSQARATAARAGSGARSAGYAAPGGASRWPTTPRTAARAAGPAPLGCRARTACAATLSFRPQLIDGACLHLGHAHVHFPHARWLIKVHLYLVYQDYVVVLQMLRVECCVYDASAFIYKKLYLHLS